MIPQSKSKKRHQVLMTVLLLYVGFIIITRVHYEAQEGEWVPLQEELIYSLTFAEDGNYDHYYIELDNENLLGTIFVRYVSSSNTVHINARNIEKLVMDCRSIFEEKAYDLFGINPPEDFNYYKRFLMEKDLLNLKVDSDSEIELEVFDIPTPARVLLNNKILTYNQDYTFHEGFLATEVPKGHSDVDIYFSDPGIDAPSAMFTVSPSFVGIDDVVVFNASSSHDIDGTIDYYMWDFSDGNYSYGKSVTHRYDRSGNYSVILTIRDNDLLVDMSHKMIHVILHDLDTDGDGLPDLWEMDFGLDPEDPEDRELDLDLDGLSNIVEFYEGTYPDTQDSDRDGISDAWELKVGLDPLRNNAGEDPDKDGFSNYEEFLYGTDPFDGNDTPPDEGSVNEGGSEQGPSLGPLVRLILLGVVIMVLLTMLFLILHRSSKKKDDIPAIQKPEMNGAPVLTASTYEPDIDSTSGSLLKKKVLGFDSDHIFVKFDGNHFKDSSVNGPGDTIKKRTARYILELDMDGEEGIACNKSIKDGNKGEVKKRDVQKEKKKANMDEREVMNPSIGILDELEIRR